ncbi:hypothetical protein ABZ312_09870 [Streptomyces sp. NPDC006207]
MASRRSRSIPAARVVGLKDLQTRMATANDLAYHLDYTSEPEDFEKVMEALDEAYWIAADLARKKSRTGCTDHPHGPIDPLAPEGWGSCLICNGRRRSGKTGERNRTGALLTGATSDTNRPAERVAAAREPSPAEAARWRMPDEPRELDSPILAARRSSADRTHAAALARARQERATKTKTEPPNSQTAARDSHKHLPHQRPQSDNREELAR